MREDYESPTSDFKKLGVFLSTPISVANKDNAKRQLAEAITWVTRVAWLKRNAEYHYRKDMNTFLLPKAKEYTDLDREVRVKAQVADVAKDYGYLQDVEVALQLYINACHLLI